MMTSQSDQLADRVCWSGDQSADSGADGAADRVCWSGDQVADSGVGVMTSRPTGYVGVVTSRLTVGWWD